MYMVIIMILAKKYSAMCTISIQCRMTARDVITHSNQCKISCKIHFRMANMTRIQMCAVLEPQL